MSQNNQTLGNWNQEGLLNSFKKKGVTTFSAISEYIGNSIDANASKIGIYFDEKSILYNNNLFQFIDNGSGMNQHKIRNMFSNYRSNHKGDKSIGTVGIGAKLGNALISNYQFTSYIYTKSRNNNYLKVKIPWGDIYEDKRYEGQIILCDMNDKEISYFQNKMLELHTNSSQPTNTKPENLTGTIITHYYDENIDLHYLLYELICNQFDRNRKEDEYYDKKKRWDCMFCIDNLELFFTDNIYGEYKNQKLERYIHMNPNLNYYFNKLLTYEIRVYHNMNEGEDRNKYSNLLFVTSHQGLDYTIPKVGKGFSTKVERFIPSNFPNYVDSHNRITYQIGAEVNPEYFDPSNPLKIQDSKLVNKLIEKKELSSTTLEDYDISTLSSLFEEKEMVKMYQKFLGASMMSPYDKKFFGISKDEKIDCCKTSIIRNGQQVSSINIPNFKFSQQDGGCGTEQKTFAVVITADLISYYTLSNQNNLLDEVFGIQEIRDHIEEKKIRVDLLRLISFLRNAYTSENFKKIVTMRTVKLRELYPMVKTSKKSEKEKKEEEKRNKILKYVGKLKLIQKEMKQYKLLDTELELKFMDLLNHLS